ncbi:hypothetical protein SLS55_010317 [Diplodia seriata]|uniref:DUF7708 domain-containing protein n=1 Tax=Diplodia seriata TaxID=420778 RepID=A0ABR3C0P3_9PEZI
MATPPLPLTPRFQQRLQEFKQDLSPDQEENFKFTTLDDLKRLVHSIQEEQTRSRRLTNLRRLAPFLEAMEQFDKVVQIFLNAADLLACIWGPMKFLLLATQTYHDAFNALLDAYVDIGESIPLLAQYEQVFQDKAQMHVVLEFIYTDVLDFHASAIRYFKSPVWKQLFHATWKTFRSKFEPTLSNLRRHKSLLETESNLLFLQQYQVDRQKTQVQFENIGLQAEHNRKIAINNWLSPAESDQQDNDIGDLLKTVPSFTITGKQNSTDIRSFCHIKAETIREELDYPEEMAHRMADKVSSRADGMFVFAVLIMKYLEEQTSWKNLEREVEDMPLDLNGVYERIVKRVLYDAALAERTAARMLLGWLLIALRPLKWYLERNVIDGPEEELKLLCHCLSYLQLPAFDQHLEEKDAGRCILSGHYAFMDYALPSWTFHLINLLQHGQLEHNGVQELADSLRAFFKGHHTTANDRSIEDKAVKKMISPFKNESFLGQLAESIRLAQDLSFDEAYEKTLPNSSDYLVPQVILVRNIIEDFTLNSGMRYQLQEIHGSKLFKCPKLRCRYFSQGFVDAQERDNHVNEHERPYCCSYSGCVVALLGYPTEQQLQRHEAEAHHESPSSFTFPRHGIPTSSKTSDEIQHGNEEVFESWIDQFEGEIPLDEILKIVDGPNRDAPAKLKGPLRTAAHSGNINILNKILDRIGSVLMSSSKARGGRKLKAVDLLFIRATALGFDEVAIKLLDHERCEMAKPSRGTTYLASAIRSGRMAVVRALILIKGIDPNLKNHGETALHQAVVHDRPEVARFLVESNMCKKHSKDRDGKTAWQMAYDGTQLDLLEAIFLESTSEPDEDDEYWILTTKLIRAARKGDLPTVQAILNQPGAPVNPAGEGPTPVHLAVAGKHTAVVDALLGTGVADVDRLMASGNVKKLGLAAPRAIWESVMQNDAVLFGRLLKYSKIGDKPFFRAIVQQHGTTEMLEAVDAKIKSHETRS